MAGRNRRSGAPHTARQYPRTARINESLREVLADALERIEDVDDRLGLLTITAVECEPDLRHAVVYLSSLDDEEAEVLSQARVRLQAAISSQVRLKRTPQLRFVADPAVSAGQRVDDILRSIAPPTVEPDPTEER
ncbi:MAG TPA: 30S ribosome-binding factor RbfA [Acidimicrobiales bacterium]|nr:30S ribosome-binding factor RbfA [Acidimicrobiales bacterium]